MELLPKCLARNPDVPVRGAWRCSLPAGHVGPHRAHHNHNLADRFLEWDQPNTGSEVA